MDKAKASPRQGQARREALKAELLELYSQALDEMLESCPGQADFVVLEERVEQLATQTLPETLNRLAQAKGIFPPKLHGVRQRVAEGR